MNVKANRNTQIDWMVKGILDNPNDRNNPEAIADFVTDGFAEHGFGGEVMVVGKVKHAERITILINTFCRMLINGEKFDTSFTHCIDTPDGKTKYKFNICEYVELNGGVKYQLVPVF